MESTRRQNSPSPGFPRWLQHPLVVFAIPLFLLLGSPAIYGVLAPASGSRLINEDQLQEIASLMDDIYSTLVNMTFIPAAAVKRGPHKINSTAIPCKRDPAVLRLMEIMPYVDSFEVMEENEVQRTDWIFGGEFIDFRGRQDHLVDGCDPMRAEQYYPYMTPTMIALTDWGTGGWNSDRTFVMIYDTARNAIRVFEGEDWVSLVDEDEPKFNRPAYGEDAYFYYTTGGVFRHGARSRLALLSKDDLQWKLVFHAPTLLRRMLNAYQSLAWTPWATSNREGGWGVRDDIIRDLLRNNGWPEQFDADQFNADFIRAKHASNGRGLATAAYQTVEKLESRTDNWAYTALEDIEQYEKLIKEERDERKRWLSKYQAQVRRWYRDRQEIDLKRAKEDIRRLCPNDVCVKKEDLILWDLYSLEKEYDKAQRGLTPEQTCERHIDDIVNWATPIPELYDHCVTNRKREAHWLHLAYTQLKAEALQHCARTGCTLLQQPTLEDLIRERISCMEDSIARSNHRVNLMNDWLHALPEHAAEARSAFMRDLDSVEIGSQYTMQNIETLKEMQAAGNQDQIWTELENSNHYC